MYAIKMALSLAYFLNRLKNIVNQKRKNKDNTMSANKYLIGSVTLIIARIYSFKYLITYTCHFYCYGAYNSQRSTLMVLIDIDYNGIRVEHTYTKSIQRFHLDHQ